MILRRPLIDQIEDANVRQSLQWMYDFLIGEALLLSSFQHFTLTFTKAETELRVPHALGFVPKDIIHTYTTGAGVPDFIYEKFDSSTLVITTTGACVVRFFAGRHQ